MKDLLKELLQRKKGIIGLEAAIVLIAFVIIASAFSFMVVNQGLFATERGKAVVQEGLQQASTPLSMDGTILVRTNTTDTIVNCIVIPLRAFGIDYVALWQNETVVSLKVDADAWGNVYGGVLYDNTTNETYDLTGKKLDDFVGVTYDSATGHYQNGSYTGSYTGTAAVLAIENSNGDESLNSDEKAYMIITLASGYEADVRDKIMIDVRLEKTAPLSIEFAIPVSMSVDTWLMV